MISLKTTEPVFIDGNDKYSSLSQTIKITNAALANTQLKILVLGNFDVTANKLVFHTPVHGII
jgi:hypothetical protein